MQQRPEGPGQQVDGTALFPQLHDAQPEAHDPGKTQGDLEACLGHVEGGRDRTECKRVGYAIAHSPLVKTAFFASDPNLGRILGAIGNAGIGDLDVDRIRLWLDHVLVAAEGGRHPDYREEDGARVMKQPEITVRVDLARGAASATTWTCDFSYEYVRINADYRS